MKIRQYWYCTTAKIRSEKEENNADNSNCMDDVTQSYNPMKVLAMINKFYKY